jgi:bacterioferritin
VIILTLVLGTACLRQSDLIAERIAIDSHREMVAYVGTDDSTTHQVLERILAQEEEHAEDLASLLNELGPQANAHYTGR